FNDKGVKIDCFRDTHHITSNGASGELAALRFGYGNGFFDVQYPPNFIGVTIGNREARKAGASGKGQNFIKSLVCFNGFHVHSGSHDICSRASRKFQGAVHKGGCPSIKRAHFGRASYQRRQFFWGASSLKFLLSNNAKACYTPVRQVILASDDAANK